MYQKSDSEETLFVDRSAAGKALAASLAELDIECSCVIGLTRGGVPVAFEVASVLGVPLDVIVVKKLRAPESEELAIGAVCADGARVLHQATIRLLGVSDAYVARETEARLQEAKEAEAFFRERCPALDLAGSSVVLVDDGVATGSTMEAAVLSVRKRGARLVTVAVAVGSERALSALEDVADQVLFMTHPVDFWAVGQFYLRFPQVSNEEVEQFLEESQRQGKTHGKVARPA
jgi:putative phosphoribosyl transferase